MVQEYGLFIGGAWRKSEGKRFETRNPATGEILATFPNATKDDVHAAVRAARDAFDKWKKTPPPRRGELLLEAARIFRRKKEELGRVVTSEMGKVIAEGRGDVQEVIDFYEYAAGEGRRMFGETVPSELPSKMCLTIRLPVGPVGLITPWNFPMAIPGGKNAIIAMDDANVELLMDGVLFGAFGTAGQRCTATSRLIVHEAIYDRVVDDLVARAEKLRVGNPIDEATDMGPVASPDQEKKVLEYIEIGKKEGDKLLTGGKKLGGGAYDRGFYIAPTVFAVDRKKRLAQEEIFGPVLSVLKARDYEDAVAIANSVKYGLSSSIYTNDLRW